MLGWAKPAWGEKKVGKNPTDRGKKGTKKSVQVDGAGGPLGLVIAGANVPEAQLLQATIEAIVVDRPEPTEEVPQHLCLDGAYDTPQGREAVEAGQYTPHIRHKKDPKKRGAKSKGYKPRRWVVERTIAWLSKCRGLLIRYDKKDTNYLGLLQLACGLLWYRRLYRLGRCNAKQAPTAP